MDDRDLMPITSMPKRRIEPLTRSQGLRTIATITTRSGTAHLQTAQSKRLRGFL